MLLIVLWNGITSLFHVFPFSSVAAALLQMQPLGLRWHRNWMG